MNIKYNKILGKVKKLMIYIWVGIVFVACNILTLINSIMNISGNPKWQIVVFLSTFLIECLGFLYCLVQDIANSTKTSPPKFIFENDPSGIPFVDRKELLENIIQESAKKIMENNYYYSKNIKKLRIEIQTPSKYHILNFSNKLDA